MKPSPNTLLSRIAGHVRGLTDKRADASAWKPSADRQDENEPRLFRKKFKLPIDREIVEENWIGRGYSAPTKAVRKQAWARGKHSHQWDLLIAPITGGFEFTIAGQHFVIEPGDELFYPALAVISSANIANGDSEMLLSVRWR